MRTFDIEADVIYTEPTPYVIVDEQQIAQLKEAAKKEKDKSTKEFLQNQIQTIEEMRKKEAQNIRRVKITVKKPTPADVVEIHSASRDSDRIYDRTREPLSACVVLIQNWNLKDDNGNDIECNAENIKNEMPQCLVSLVYNRVYPMMYPTEARLAFFVQ